MKASELKAQLDSLPNDCDPDIVMGEVWLPERLTNTQLDGNLLFLEFDNAPEEDQGEEEGRGFVEHEVELIREQIQQILKDDKGLKTTSDVLLTLLVMAHERTSSEFIEIMESLDIDDEL